MIEDMHAVMRRIHEIQSRFGLNRRRTAVPQVQQSLQAQGPRQGQGAQYPDMQVQGFTGTSPHGVSEVEHAIDYIIGGGNGQASRAGGNNPLTQAGQNPLARGIQGLLGSGSGGGEGFLRTLMDNIRGDDTTGNE
jgi:hypothetical protein